MSAENKFQNQPSISKIKSNQTSSGFSDRPLNYDEVLSEFKNLDISKLK